jgi:cell wall-associated NlpC family hydrolase
MRLRFVSLAAAFSLAACSSAPVVDTASFPSVTRQECLRTAEAYRTHRWTGSGANIMHGPDSRGVQVDTPDSTYQKPGAVPGWWRTGEVNEGVPYQWGGFCTLAEFDTGLRAGKAAGDVYSSEKRRLLDDAVSAQAVGIDCSGFISRCWKLTRSYSTRELAGLCVELKSWNELKPGDILNTFNAHCLLFAGWDDAEKTRIIAYETGSPPDWKVVSHSIDAKWLRSIGYRPLRYRKMRGP